MTSEPVLAGIVLGAGRSTRLGRPKQTLPFGDTTLLGRVVRNVEASSLDEVIVVIGGAAEEARASLLETRAVVVTTLPMPTAARPHCWPAWTRSVRATL